MGVSLTTQPLDGYDQFGMDYRTYLSVTVLRGMRRAGLQLDGPLQETVERPAQPRIQRGKLVAVCGLTRDVMRRSGQCVEGCCPDAGCDHERTDEDVTVREGCHGAQFVWRDDARLLCMTCWNEDVGYRVRRVELPRDFEEIAVALSARPSLVNRNWLPGETVDDLLRENAEHGVGVEAARP